MESNKRVRTEPPEWSTPGGAWSRMVLKLLFLMTRMSTLLIGLLLGRDLRGPEELTYQEMRERKKQPFSVWPLTKKLEGTLSEVAESDCGFSMVSNSPSRASSTPSPLALDIDYYQDQRVEGNHPVCEHDEVCDLWMCRKQGRNFQRMFWRCPLPIGRQCEMFQWCAHQPHWKGQNQAYQAGRNPKSMEKSPSTSASRPPKPPTMRTPSSSMAPTTPAGEEETEAQAQCNHMGPKCRQGSNGFREKVSCQQCGKVLVDRARSQQEMEERAEIRKEKKASGSASTSSPGSKETGEATDMEEFLEFQKFREWRRQQKKPDSPN